jgi:uncharacterized protein YbjT (DUF2867 family)
LRIAIAGGTGVVGSYAADALRKACHDTVILSRSTGVDLVTGRGLDEALDSAEAVIDLTNLSTLAAKKAVAFFNRTTSNLVAAAERADLDHLLILSIVGIDRMPHGYYAGKVEQERIIHDSPVPWTILRATQFHEFAAQMFNQARVGPLRIAPRARIQPIAACEVGEHLARLALGAPQGRASDLAGPREERLDVMVKKYAHTLGHRSWIPSLSLPGAQMRGMRAGRAIPEHESVFGRQTFEEWLTTLLRDAPAQ